MLFVLSPFMVPASVQAQWVVSDPGNLVQGIVNSVNEMVETSETAQNALSTWKETSKIFEQGREYYDKLRKVNDLISGSEKVKESVLMLSDISEIYVNNFGKMLTDKNFSQRELNAIAAGYNTIMKKSSRSIAELKNIINRIIESNSEETIPRFADYRNYMTYEILITNDVLNRAKLSRQTGYSSGAEVQIPYLLILTSTLLMIYYQRTNSTRLVFIDEPFAKMDPGNVKLMLDFMKQQKLQVIFCSPDKTETIGNECEVILPVLRVRPDSMQLGIVQLYEREDGR